MNDEKIERFVFNNHLSQTIRINSIREEQSLCDGPGLRTVIFLQGCNMHCPGCHNKSSWDVAGGVEYCVAELAKILREKCPNKKLTISGGEPLLQSEAVEVLCEELSDFDLCLYTGHELCDVPQTILSHLRFVKTGSFVESKHSSVLPFVGSSNQRFIDLLGGKKNA